MAASSFGDAIADTFKSFWHTMTSNDRHSTYNSPYRTGRHVPLNGNTGHLTSVATANESRADLSSPYRDEAARSSTGLERRNTGYEGAGAGVMSPGGIRPYSPGLRGEGARRHSQQNEAAFETQSNGGEIPMQSFQDGLPPPPPVSHSWQRIDAWTEENYPELTDQICEGCTTNDLNELEHMLDCSLPMEIRESLQVHDGQERGGLPTGIIFGSMLLDCEEIVQEWQNWKTVNQEFLIETTVVRPTLPSKAFGGGMTNGGGSSQASSSRDRPPRGGSPAENSNWRQDLSLRQDCVPAGAVKKAYAHPAWIPLVRDWGGNNLAVDLAPGPSGTWGQIILFGRDYDTKYVVARSWAAFLALVADDMNSGKWFIDEDSGELKLREFKSTRVEPGYFDILRWRMDQKYGRRVVNKRKSVVPGAASPTGLGSPYASPTEPSSSEPRGRPLQRLSGSSPLASPNRPGYGKPSPLSQVAEEIPFAPLAALPELTIPNGKPREKLVEVETPKITNGDHAFANGIPSAVSANTPVDTNASPGLTRANGKQPAIKEDTMKTIEI